MTLMTMIKTATPKVTPSTEISVITETKVLLGRKYLTASSSSNGSRDMRRTLNGSLGGVNELNCARKAELRQAQTKDQGLVELGLPNQNSVWPPKD